MNTFIPAFWAAMLLASPALAAPQLTTIQDVLYKADGTRFNGTLVISWNSFEAADRSPIVMQSVTVKVVDGNLRVQLVPTTTTTLQSYYTVVYNSDGRVQFNEIWSVPLSSQPLRIRDVRAAAPLANDTTPPTSVQESDVVGLIADLAARPTKGPAFAGGRVAMVNALGALDSVTGSAGDCVRVDGSSGPCGGQTGGDFAFTDGDIPTGIVDGSNASFTLSATPTPSSSLALYLNGLLQAAGVDYNLVNNDVVRFLAASIPQPGDTLLASYRIAGGDSGGSQPYAGAQVLCGAVGTSVSGATLASLGACTIPAGVLQSGDRVEMLFDLAHQGSGSGFSFELHWGATTVLQRTGAASDALVSGRADAGLDASGAQIAGQSWGTVLPFAAAIASAADAYGSGLVIDFRGKMNSAGETLTLRNYAVVRLP